MPNQRASPAPTYLLGIEGGGTRTRAIWADPRGRALKSMDFGPGNLRLLSPAALADLLKAIRKAAPHPMAIGIGMAGARTASDRQRIETVLRRLWPGIPSLITHDLETALQAAPSVHPQTARILILSGTGSCCYGSAPNGRTIKIGGWGHLLGDKGSAYDIGLRALKAVVFYWDRDGKWPPLGSQLLQALQINEPDQLIDWVRQAPKDEVAALARVVAEQARRRDPIARDLLKGAAAGLAKDALACAQRLCPATHPPLFLLAGGMMRHTPILVRLISAHLRRVWPKAMIRVLKSDSALGAVRVAQLALLDQAQKPLPRTGAKSPRIRPAATATLVNDPSLETLRHSPTEQRNPRSRRLDQLTTKQAVRLMLSEDRGVPERLLHHAEMLALAVDWIAHALRRGGRLFYVGAGTSGRLGVLDASECPPTFQTHPEMVQGIIAGGRRALWESIEGAEDNAEAGGCAVEFRGVRKGDVVVGIAASGRTPFVWGALRTAKRRRARTILLCFNPHLAVPPASKPHLILAIDVGPEILTGSTRLKAGTATKLVLNIFTTLSMIRLGKVLGNLMVDVKASNSKLRARAIHLVQTLTQASDEECRKALEGCDWNVRRAAHALGFTRGKMHRPHSA